MGINTANEGALGELIVTVDLMRRGYEVFRAVSPGTSCDLLISKDGTLIRTEVTKGSRYKEKLVYTPHKKQHFDLLAVWESNGVITYLGKDV